MKKQLVTFAKGFIYSLPIRLLANHFKRNQVLLLCWVLLFAIVTGNFGNYLGIPYLFLDPVYLNQVNFTSFFIVGVVIAGFSIAFHITTYITDGHRFTFIGTISRPFTVFSFNNSIIPFAFIICYVIFIIQYQFTNEFSSSEKLMIDLAGLITGYLLMTLLLFVYFWFTNKDIFKYVVCKVDEKLKQNIKATRAGAMKKLKIARSKQLHVTSYLTINMEVKKVTNENFYDKETILQVFDQNHFNLVIIEIIIFIVLIVMGAFKDYEILQLPAAASFVLFLTVFVMFAGAFSYWFGNWSGTAALIILLTLNFTLKQDVFSRTYEAFGLDYEKPPAAYNLNAIAKSSSKENYKSDVAETLPILENWKAKFTENKKPKMVFICVSGGGQRAALWTLNTLQKADSITNGQLLKNTMLITGASGGLIGASYFRGLALEKSNGDEINLYSKKHLENISNDNLNSIIFSMLMNDVFTGFSKFEYEGHKYSKDRGYSFENQFNKNTLGVLDKTLNEYKEPEYESKIPMMILAPTIVNDGRKLYISPQHVSYMSSPSDTIEGDKINGVDFLRFFEKQGSKNLRYLSGIRMSATFPYITPNISLPSDPPIDIMDAGVTDNFGITDAVKFLYTFREWISANTSGVIIFSIRDSEKNATIQKETNLSLFERFSLPISSIYQNFESLQDITNDNKIESARAWFDKPIDRVNIQYIPKEFSKENLSKSDSLRMENVKRASLSWRLTSREKQSLIKNINTNKNQTELMNLKKLILPQEVKLNK